MLKWLVLVPGAIAVWIGQQRERLARRPRFGRIAWFCGRCGKMHATFGDARRCDHSW